MDSRARHLTILFSLVAVLIAALPAVAQASPDGDDDPTYNAGSAFGTQYSLLDDADDNDYLTRARPVTDQAPDGSSVTAVIMEVPNDGASTYRLRLTRFDSAGQPVGTPAEEDLPTGLDYTELLDIRVLSGSIVVLARAFDNSEQGRLVKVSLNPDFTLINTREYMLPKACRPAPPPSRVLVDVLYYGIVDAARVTADGGIRALWDCDDNDRTEVPTERSQRLGSGDPNLVFVTSYDAGSTDQESEKQITSANYGEDLELGPNGDPYALVGEVPETGGRAAGDNGTSRVFRMTVASGALQTIQPVNGSQGVDGSPVDLAVDSQGRALVWSQPDEVKTRDAGTERWVISRLAGADLLLDPTWGGGTATVTDPRLDEAFGGAAYGNGRYFFLVVRPGDKVLALGRHSGPESPPRAADSHGNGIIVGLTSGGQVDTGFSASGFKDFFYDGLADYYSEFERIGEPTLQSDGKVLIPHTSEVQPKNDDRIASPPATDGPVVGVTRLVGPSSPGTTVSPSAPVTPSAVPTICGRRAISLVRADVKGKKVKLTGLVGAALYGKKVTIQTDPKGARNSKFTKTGTVTASRTTGAFTATVPRPKKADFVSIRYRAVSGSAKSPLLKLPQRLTSRSVKSAKNTITVKGKVKKSVLGKRNKVLVRRLVCGRYRTVGSARPDKNGNYTVTFASTQIRGVAFYRAESKVLRKRGSKKYVIQYARAIAIRTTSQTG